MVGNTSGEGRRVRVHAESEAPRSSPWGKVQDSRRLAAGIWKVGTSGHGGIKLSRGRNAAMPTALRIEGGWYEEDCEWALVHLAFADEFPETREEADRTVRNWMPDLYEAHTGERLTAARSHEVARREFVEATGDRFVVTSAFGDWAAFVPTGMVGVAARRASDGAEQWHMVPGKEYEARTGHGFVVDEARHPRVPAPDAAGRASKPRPAPALAA